MQKCGVFITFEGPEGSGKTTHSKLLCDFLRKKGFRILHTREPGGTAIGEHIRRLLLDPEHRDMDALTEMLLYMAARAQIVKQKILPALRERKVVICDRFMDATLAYQGYAGGLDRKIIDNAGRLVTRGVKPDMTILLDIDVEKGLLRTGNIKDRMERKPLLYHKRVRKGYLAIAKKEPRRIKVVSTAGDVSEIQNHIRDAALKLCHSKI